MYTKKIKTQHHKFPTERKKMYKRKQDKTTVNIQINIHFMKLPALKKSRPIHMLLNKRSSEVKWRIF